MQRLGSPDRVAQGLAVVRVGDLLEIGTQVVDADLDPVGTVVDVFGPVDAPYVAISPSDGTNPASLVGSPLYVR